jgi:hypothetical protein
MNFLNNSGPCGLYTLSTALTACLSECLSSKELSLLGHFLLSVGSLLLARSSQKENCAASACTRNPGKMTLDELEAAVKALRKSSS